MILMKVSLGSNSQTALFKIKRGKKKKGERLLVRKALLHTHTPLTPVL